MNYIALAIIFIPLYAFGLVTTIFTVRSDPHKSCFKDISEERDKTIVINGIFLLLVTFALMQTVEEAGTVVWLFATYGCGLDLLFAIPNNLSQKFWTWTLRAIALLSAIASLATPTVCK